MIKTSESIRMSDLAPSEFVTEMAPDVSLVSAAQVIPAPQSLREIWR